MLLQTSWLFGLRTLDPFTPVIIISYLVHFLDHFSFSWTSKCFTSSLFRSDSRCSLSLLKLQRLLILKCVWTNSSVWLGGALTTSTESGRASSTSFVSFSSLTVYLRGDTVREVSRGLSLRSFSGVVASGILWALPMWILRPLSLLQWHLLGPIDYSPVPCY